MWRAAFLLCLAAACAAAGQERPRRLTPEDYAAADVALWSGADAVVLGRIAAARPVAGRGAVAVELDTLETLRGARRARWSVLLRPAPHLAETAERRAAALSERVGDAAVVAIEAPPERVVEDCALGIDSADCLDALLAAQSRAGTPLAAVRGADGAYLDEVVRAPVCLGDLATDDLGCSGGNAGCVALENVVSKRVYCAPGGLLRFDDDPLYAAMLHALRKAAP